jgi:hypothetical protein
MSVENTFSGYKLNMNVLKIYKLSKDKKIKKPYHLFVEVEPSGRLFETYKLYSEVKKNGRVCISL